MKLGPWVMLGFWGLALIGISALTRQLLARALRRSFEYAVLPGTLVHELSHAVGCLVTGARITRFALLERDGGYVAHTEPKIPVVGQVLISLSPIIGCGACLILCAGQLELIGGGSRLPAEVLISADGLGSFVANALSAHGSVLARLGNLEFGNLFTYVWLYLAICMAAMLGPSRQDLRNCALGVVVLVGAFWLLGLALSAMNAGGGAIQNLPKHAWGGISAVVTLSVLMAAGAAGVRGIQVGIGSLRGGGARNKA